MDAVRNYGKIQFLAFVPISSTLLGDQAQKCRFSVMEWFHSIEHVRNQRSSIGHGLSTIL